MWRALFVNHLRQADESYPAHMRVAAGVGFRMLGGALACFVHAVIPGLFLTRGSDTIRALYRDVQPRSDGVIDATTSLATPSPRPSVPARPG